MTGVAMTILASVVFWLAAAAAAWAQALPSEPVRVAGGRLVLSGDVAWSVAPTDPGFFNYTDYEHSTFRELRLAMTASLRATERISVLGELRSENFDHVSPFALYARIRPFPGRNLDVQIGRVPPTFGAFPRRAYGRDNPLIGYPLAFQYLTSLRADAVPDSVDELLRMRGRGWRSQFSVGAPSPAPGVPLATAFRWDTGVQVSSGWRAVTAAASVTSGSASNPRVRDDNPGKQIAVRVAATPTTGLVLGTSFSHGEFVSRAVVEELGLSSGADFSQRAHGADVEYARDRWIVRSEAVYSEWRLPLPAEGGLQARPLRALAIDAEGRLTLAPGLYAAGRVGHLTFNRVASAAGLIQWEAPVSRVEAGGGYYLQHNIVARASWQYNSRPGGRVARDHLVGAQVLYWF
jgi:hypothetical protein